MAKTKSILILFIVAGIALPGCKKISNPRIVATNNSYLVIEGVINTANDSTIFNISRTVQVASKADSVAETQAVVNIEGDNSSSYPLPELGGGRYGAPPLGLDTTHRYRIHIRTIGGKEYVSDFIATKYTPPIDSIGYLEKSKGAQLYVTTHDPKNNTRYYRWDYQETWKFHSNYISLYVSNGKAIIRRRPDSDVYYCYTGDRSSAITVGSSAKLQQDVIYQQPLTFIPSTSEKIEMKYSILVRQYALTPDAYNYWNNLKKNTQQIGSIFDAQPSELAGNVHCVTNPAEPVIGYVSAGNIQQKRIFIIHDALPVTWQTVYPYACELDTVLYCAPPGCVNQVATALIPLPPEAIPIDAVLVSGQENALGFFSSTPQCVDCTIRGTKKQPIFWR